MNKGLIWTLVGVVVIVIFLGAFIGCERIDAGHVGIKVNNVGGEKGVSKSEYVTGWVWYLKTASRVYEFPTYQQHVEYEAFVVPAKGGTIFTVHPSFNYAVNAGEVSNMFQKLRQSNKALENGFILNSLRVALREATNTFTVDSILNNVSKYDAAVIEVLNKGLQPYFTVSQFTSGLTPDTELAKLISQKAQAIQNAIKIENEQKAIRAQAENDIIGARRDSTVKVMAAEAEAKAIRLKQDALKESPQYVELIKAQTWDGKLPVYMLGNGQGMFLNLNPR